MIPSLSALLLPDAMPVSSFVVEAAKIESFGIQKLWTYDHLSWRDLRDGPWFAAVPLLTAAALGTRNLRVGTQVASPNFRHPVTFAKELLTLDHLSEGRVEVGVGAGTVGDDAQVLGGRVLSPRERTARFDEWVTLLRRLLAKRVTDFEGLYYKAVDARQIPGPMQAPRIPVTIAAAGPKALEIVARQADAWVSYGGYPGTTDQRQWFEAIAQQSQTLDGHLRGLGRDPASVRRIAQVPLDEAWPFASRDSYREMLGRLGELGVDELTVHWPRRDGRGMPRQALEFVLDAHGLAAGDSALSANRLGPR